MHEIRFSNCKTYHPIAEYSIGKNLGSGSFSVVKECFSKTSRDRCAIKIIKKSKLKDLSILENEVNILKRIDSHPNITKLKDVYETEEELFLVMEFIAGGELYESLINYGPFSEDTTFEIFRQIVDAVTYLHKNGIAHRDIKLENILWTESSNELKLTDFGLAKSVSLSDVEFMSTPCGTPSYVAPEIIKGQHYTQAVDLWALGVVLYLLLFCKYPFPGDSLGEIYARIETGKVTFPAEIESSTEVQDLICNLLKEDAHSRYTLEDVTRHPWMQAHWANLNQRISRSG